MDLFLILGIALVIGVVGFIFIIDKKKKEMASTSSEPEMPMQKSSAPQAGQPASPAGIPTTSAPTSPAPASTPAMPANNQSQPSTSQNAEPNMPQ